VAIFTALISYLFWASLSMFTFFVLKNFVDRPLQYLGALLILLTPLSGWNYAILGTIGNLKFGFLYIAFLLMIKRITEYEWTRINKIIYICCIFTNPMAIIFLPGFLYSRESQFTKKRMDLIIAFALVLVTIIIVRTAARYPLPDEYASGAWTSTQFLEVIIGRTVFFALAADFYQNLSTFIVGLLFLIVFATSLSRNNRNRFYGIVAIGTAITASLILMFTRGGLNLFYNGYKDPGPAQFFYPQNMIIIFAFIILLGGSNFYSKKQLRWKFVSSSFLLLLYLLFNMQGIGFNGIGVNGAWQTEKGSINQNLQKLCNSRESKEINIPIMPGEPWVMSMPRNEVCSNI
jgi:hypothetical protein